MLVSARRPGKLRLTPDGAGRVMQILVSSIFAVILGALFWTVTEYYLHRFVFHGSKARGDGAREHRQHHAQVDYFAPWQKKAKAALAATALMLPIGILASGLKLGLAFTLGFVAMYLLYEILHRRAHTHPPTGPYGRWRRRNHFAHHFVDPRRAQGVSSPIWDHVFGTVLPVEKVPVPRRLAMPWLVDADGEILAAHANDYELVGGRHNDERTRRADSEAALANRRPDSGTIDERDDPGLEPGHASSAG
jgi:hypothetical protein